LSDNDSSAATCFANRDLEKDKIEGLSAHHLIFLLADKAKTHFLKALVLT
jgi:hypothetical protein